MVTCVCLDKQLQLETMRNVCVQMGTEITPGYSTDSYFTAACREAWDASDALDSLGLTIEAVDANPKLQRGFKRACENQKDLFTQ